MSKRARTLIVLCSAVLGLALPQSVVAAELIANGSFESGFTGWTSSDQLGSAGSFSIQSGTASPVNGFAVPPPPSGTNAAMTDQDGPGSHVLYQDFLLAAPVASATLSFRLFVNNGADAFHTPGTLDFATAALNQQARVDILAAGVDPFSVGLADVLLNAFATLDGDLLVSGYTLYTIDVTALLNAHVGEALRLRFAEVDNVLFFNFGVDDVRITTDAGRVPESPTWLLAIAGLLGFAVVVPRRTAS